MEHFVYYNILFLNSRCFIVFYALAILKQESSFTFYPTFQQPKYELNKPDFESKYEMSLKNKK